MRRIAGWSIEGVGVAVGLLTLGHLAFDVHRDISAYAEVSLPLSISGAIVVFGRVLYHRSIIRETDRRALVTVGLLAGGSIFGLILTWSLAIGTLESDLPSGVIFPILLNGIALGAITGGVVAAILLQLREQRNELREKTARLERLASIVSHDIRNPLSVARGRVELAQETGDTANFAPLAAALDRIEMIIENMMTLIRETRSVEVTTVIALETVAEAAWRMVETGDVELHVVQSMQLQADETKLRHVFENLFRNAVEHGGETVTTVRVGTIDSRGFYVEDDGVGVAAENRDTMFDWGTSEGDYNGTSIGLAIVHEIVSAHGWEIAVTESECGGARFEVTGIELWSG